MKKVQRLLTKIIALVFYPGLYGAVIGFELTFGQVNTWTGAIDSDWHRPCNWSLGTVPACSDTVILPSVTNKPVVSDTGCFDKLEVQTGSNLTVLSPSLLQQGCPCTPTVNGACCDTWTQKANFGGASRDGAVGFSIGNKGYIGTGSDPSIYSSDFWEWNQVTNTWTQKADFGGSGRRNATGFSIGTKGYIGTGDDGSNKKDFWEWDQSSNTWTRKADFSGVGRKDAVGFSIAGKGYIGTGAGGGNHNDFWEYTPGPGFMGGSWTQKANFGGTARNSAVGFSIGSKGYIGTGDDGARKKDFWEYDPVTDAWTQKAAFGGTARAEATGFSIGTKGYIGTGQDNSSMKNDFWEWDQNTNTWTQRANFSGAARTGAVGFSIGDKGYIGCGDSGASDRRDFYEYCQ